MLPAAVREKAERANQMIANGGNRAAASSAPAPAPTPPTPAQPAPTGGGDVASLKAEIERLTKDLAAATSRYTVLQGKFNAETPRLQQQVRDLQEQLNEANTRLNRKVEPGDISGLSDDDVRLVGGPDVVKAFGKIAQQVASGEVDGRLKPVADSVKQLTQQTEANYFATLDSQVPNWEQQNDDPGFIAWLNDVDPGTKRLRFDLIKHAEQQRQGFRVAEIFKAYLEKREIGAQASAAPPVPPISPPEGGGGDLPNVSGDDKKIWRQSDIRAFYDAKRRGEYRDKPDEARAIESDILLASRENRVRSG